jgi:hypothetical protein
MRWYKVTQRRYHKGIGKPSIVYDIAISHIEDSQRAMDNVVALAAQKMSSDWSTEAREISNKHFCELAWEADDFGIWMLTDTAIKEGA